MYIVREIFYLQFGRYKEAKVLIDKATQGGLFPQTTGNRVLTDFTGESYRLMNPLMPHLPILNMN